MLKISRLWTMLSATGLGFLLEIALFCYGPFASPTTPQGPATLQEVARLAEEMGLYWRSDRKDGAIKSRLVVSNRPLTAVRANLVRFNCPEHPCWVGTIAISRPWQHNISNYDPEYSVVWGDMFVYGDPEIIRRLTGRSP
jgi:hypothetical protein